MPPLRNLSRVQPYAVAALLAALAVGGRAALSSTLGEGVPFILAYPATAFLAWWYGVRPALLCVAICAAGPLLVEDQAVTLPELVVRLVAFVLSATLIAAIAAARERSASRLDRAEQARQAGEAQLGAVMDAVPALISYIDADLRYQRLNQAYRRWFGVDPAAVRGKPVREVLGEEAWAQVRPHMERALAGQVVEYEQELPYPGGPRWVQVIYTPDRAPDGRVRGFVVLVNDIAHRRASEELLRRSALRADRLRRTATALSGSPSHAQMARVIVEQGIPALGATAGCVGHLVDAGRTLELIGHHGCDPEAIRDWLRTPIERRSPLTEAVREGRPVLIGSLEEHSAAYPDLPIATLDEIRALAVLPLVVSGRVIGAVSFGWAEARTFGGDDLELLGSFSDLCAQALERARLHAAEQEARAHAEAANRSKDEFLAMLGHELRNPLAPITTALHVLRLRGDTSREWAIVERQARHLTQLVDDLLDVARVTRGKLELRRDDLDLRQALARGVEIAGPLFEQRQHQLRIERPPQPLPVRGDETRLAQVFANLLTNAAKYTPERGHVWVAARCEGAEAVVTVRDDGAGIAQELLPGIFDLFVQGPRSPDRAEGGLGLGLALVRNIVSLHGGSVAAESEGPGRGSLFTVRLPLALAPAETPAAPASHPARADGRALRVLVVDDNEDAAGMLGELLSSLGHDVRVAHDGPRALQALEGFAAQVALLDLGLPVMDGLELGRLIRARAAPSGTPALVAVTGYGQPEDRTRTADAGFVAHLVKPVEVEALLEALETCAAS